jgi:anti-sigma factor RsiW
MRCREFALAILEYLEGELDAPRRRAFLRHLSGCGDCARYLESYRASVALAREAAGGPVGEEMPEELVRSILAARDTASVRSIFSGIRGPSHLWNLAAGIAASQILFFYFGS